MQLKKSFLIPVCILKDLPLSHSAERESYLITDVLARFVL
jgi:hypothetical protein